jgi:hypothetical protein
VKARMTDFGHNARVGTHVTGWARSVTNSAARGIAGFSVSLISLLVPGWLSREQAT